MSNKGKLYQILDYILNQASSAELDVITEALKRRTPQPGQGIGGINPQGLAQNLAKDIQDQLTESLDIQRISRNIVTELIRQQEPEISDEELNVLLDHWLPEKENASSERIRGAPPDVLISMIAQYIAFKQGKMSKEEEKELPENWIHRYWEAFPEVSRALIIDYLNGKIDEVHFWEKIINTSDQ